MLRLLSPQVPSVPCHPLVGEPWTPPLAEEFLDRHDAAVTAAFLRVQEEMLTAHPGQGLFLARYDARSLLRSCPVRTAFDAQLVAMVQVRTASGRIVSATIHVPWESAGVVVRGWPEDRP